MRTVHNELENEPYILEKLRMSIFCSILRIVNIIFLEEVMGILTLKGSKAAEQFVTPMSKAHACSKRRAAWKIKESCQESSTWTENKWKKQMAAEKHKWTAVQKE